MEIILFFLLIIISKEYFTDILVLKFKTYYPTTYNMSLNNTEYNSNDFISSFLFSQLYLELNTENQQNLDKVSNQTLNTIISAKTDSFILRNLNRNNITICNFNASLSNTFRLNMLSPSFCQSEEIFKIYTDISMSEYLKVNFTLDNYFCFNDSICGEVGIDISTYKNNKDFISKMKKILDKGTQNFAFHYSSDKKDEGIFVFGDMPHNYLKNKYNENDLITFFSNDYIFEIKLDTVTFDGREYFSNEKDDLNYYDYINIAFSPDTEGIEFDKFFFNILLEIYFNDYIEKKICKIEEVELITIIYCYGNKFGKEDINKFPRIIFSKFKFNFNISFENEELFYYQDNKYFCKIYYKLGQSKRFLLGRIFLRKYLPVFNAGENSIYFYNKIIEKNGKESFLEKYQKIIIISFIALIIIFLILGILIGKMIYKERRKHANELDDKYEYQANKKNGVEPLYNPKEDEK